MQMERSRRVFFQQLASLIAAGAGVGAGISQAARAAAAGGPPSRLEMHKSGELRERGEKLYSMMNECELCPRMCGAKRLEGERGFCRASAQLEISSYHPHFGEERPLVGRGGSGTIFLTNCSLRCVFCINWDISHRGDGVGREIDEMASMMIELERMGCVNINVVTPTHYSPHIVLALDKAVGKGLGVPLVWNTCGWERVEVLKILDGIVDIYLPDFKYSSGDMAARYSAGARDYPKVTQKALLEMQRQVGTAHPAPDGLVHRGLMIRHLVMPNGVSGTGKVIHWIAQNLPKDTYLNLMSQYTPAYMASRYPDIARRITREEFEKAVRQAEDAGLTNLDIQPMPR
jgi:putative pyruvate formate lyase activating enzyme